MNELVRRLAWLGEDGKSYRQANTAIGQYQISWLVEFECWQLGRPHALGKPWRDNFSRHASRDDAMAAAQADYTARILAALDLTAVEALQAKHARLKDALNRIADMPPFEPPPPAYDDYGWQIADTAERHAERVSDIAIWEIVSIARAALEATDGL